MAGPSKRILVTGGCGFIGSHTVVELVASGFEVEVLDNLCNSSRECLRRVESIVGRRIEFHLVDLCNAAAVELLFQRRHFDAVVHFAGLKAVGESTSIPLRYYENNLVGSINLFKAMEKHGCRNVVFSSSATVYGFAREMPIKEEESLKPTNPYGRTKLFLEEMLRDIASGRDGDQWRVVLLRYFNPVGAHESGLIGEDPEGIPNNLMPFIAQVAVGRLPLLNVYGNDYETPDGTGVRDYIHVTDLARGHVAALKNGIFGAMPSNCEAFNLGTGRGLSVLEMLRAMEKACGRKLEYKVAPRRKGDVAISFADPSKAKRLLGWDATLGLDRMVADTWRWQSRNPTGFREAAPSAAAAAVVAVVEKPVGRV